MMKAAVVILASLSVTVMSAHLPEHLPVEAEPSHGEEDATSNMMRSPFQYPAGLFNSPYEVFPQEHFNGQFHGDPLSVYVPHEEDLKAKEEIAELKELYAQQDGDGEQRFLLPSITLMGNSVSLSTSSFLSLLKKLYSAFSIKTTVVTLIVPVPTTTTVVPTAEAMSSSTVSAVPLPITTENPIESTDATTPF